MKRLLPLAAFLLIASPAYSQVNLGTSASVTNPQRSGDATTGLSSATTGAVSISSGGIEIMRVNGTGVGIGTTGPIEKLQVAGNILLGNGGDYPHKIMMAGTGVGTEYSVFEATDHLHLTLNSGAWQNVDIPSGNVGIGTSSPAGTLDVEGGTAAASTNGSPINLVAQSAGTGNQNGGNIILTPGTATGTGTAGAVGIGTTTPANPLSVNGIIQSLTGGFKFPDGTTQTTAGVSPGSNGMVLLATVNASGASSVTFGSTYISSTYNKYVIEFDSLLAATSAENLELQVSANNGSTWQTSGYYYSGYGYNIATGTVYSASTTGTYIDIANGETLTNTSHNVASGTIKFASPSGTDKTMFDYKISGYDNSDAMFSASGGGFYNTAGAINAIKMFMHSGNISGNFHLYGLTGT